MYSNCLNKLEYNKILELLSNECITYLGKEFALNLLPINKPDRVLKLLQETDEALNLIVRKGVLPIVSFENIDIYLKSLESYYSLNTKGLLEIGKILKLSNEIKKYFYSDNNFDLSEFSNLDNYFSNLYTNEKIQKEILNSIIDENTIADNASKVLLNLRKNRNTLEAEIKNTLNNMIHSISYSKYIMDPIVTIRNDRYVIPVKEEFRGNIKGFIHDVSASRLNCFY